MCPNHTHEARFWASRMRRRPSSFVGSLFPPSRSSDNCSMLEPIRIQWAFRTIAFFSINFSQEGWKEGWLMFKKDNPRDARQVPCILCFGLRTSRGSEDKQRCWIINPDISRLSGFSLVLIRTSSPMMYVLAAYGSKIAFPVLFWDQYREIWYMISIAVAETWNGACAEEGENVVITSSYGFCFHKIQGAWLHILVLVYCCAGTSSSDKTASPADALVPFRIPCLWDLISALPEYFDNQYVGCQVSSLSRCDGLQHHL